MKYLDVNLFGKAIEADLNKFEEINSIKIPLDYKSFILENNGGKPSKNIVPTVNSDVNWLYGFHEGPTWANIYDAIGDLYDRVPYLYIPIGCDSGGNQYLMSLNSNNHGCIYFWDHEDEATFSEKEHTENYYLASSFTEFINMLTE